MIKDQGVYIAHCPESNTDIASGIAPIRRYLDMGLHVGLGTDVAGGFSLSMFRAIADAIQVSKLRWRLMDQTQAPVTLEEAFTWPRSVVAPSSEKSAASKKAMNSTP